MSLSDLKIIRSKRRSLALIINGDATLTIRAPFKLPLSYIEKFIATKTKWIEQAINKIKSKPQPKKRQFKDQETFLYLGHEYKLNVDAKHPKKIKLRENFHIHPDKIALGLKELEKWYRKQSKKLISERCLLLAEKHNLKVQKIRISGAKTRWGSCGIKGNLSFSWRLIMAPMFVIDYVIAHELAHLVHHNHSKNFWNKVEELMPNHQTAKKWLKENGRELNLNI